MPALTPHQWQSLSRQHTDEEWRRLFAETRRLTRQPAKAKHSTLADARRKLRLRIARAR